MTSGNFLIIKASQTIGALEYGDVAAGIEEAVGISEVVPLKQGQI